jgi:hypothetical protein
MIQRSICAGSFDRSRYFAIAIPARSLPWMHPTTSAFFGLSGSPRSIAMIGRPDTDRPIATVRVSTASCLDLESQGATQDAGSVRAQRGLAAQSLIVVRAPDPAARRRRAEPGQKGDCRNRCEPERHRARAIVQVTITPIVKAKTCSTSSRSGIGQPRTAHATSATAAVPATAATRSRRFALGLVQMRAASAPSHAAKMAETP